VSIESGRHRLGPDNAELSLRTERAGAAAKAGHDLRIVVTSWEAELVVGEGPAETRMGLTADATSLRVVEGTGGMKALGDEDIANIHQTIDDEILKRQDIAFRSTSVQAEPGGSNIQVEGDLTIVGETRPIAFELAVSGAGTLTATAVVTQTVWGMKPYSALFGALKVKDEVLVELEGHL
jgi:polyisoprenoid-binding protein YceI